MENVDITDILLGNPGIGGTQYEMFLLAKLMLLNNTKYDFKLLLTHPQKGFAEKNIAVAKQFSDVISYCEKEKVDILISRENKFFDLINSLTYTKAVFWIHNFVSYEMIKKIGNCNKIARVIFVSKQQYDFYLEYNINKKSTYIFNSLAFPERLPLEKKKQNNVVFTGNIVPIKRLHLVTKMWPYIKKKVPDANLIVIGTGASAHRDRELGPNGLASPSYEKIILKPLLDANVLSSVKFLGILGKEKNEIIQTAKVGVSPNKDETFCLSAVEYVLNGVPVVGVAKGGINDVIMNNETGLLYRSQKKIRKAIVDILLNKKSLSINEDSIARIKKKFGFDVFYQNWINNIDEALTDSKVRILSASKPKVDKAKWLGSFFRTLRRVFHLPEAFSRLGIYRLFKRGK